MTNQVRVVSHVIISSNGIAGPAQWYVGQIDPEVGGFGKYLFFLFAPTLLYRDHYPRYASVM